MGYWAKYYQQRELVLSLPGTVGKASESAFISSWQAWTHTAHCLVFIVKYNSRQTLSQLKVTLQKILVFHFPLANF